MLGDVSPIGVIHDHGLWMPSNRGVASFARRRRIRLVVSPRGMMTAWAMKYRAFKKKIAWFMFQQQSLASAAGFHATSSEEAEDIRRLGFRQPLAVIPNGVDFPVSWPARTRSVARRLLFLSRIHPKKGLIPLVHAGVAHCL